jgi:hypothetical protein
MGQVGRASGALGREHEQLTMLLNESLSYQMPDARAEMKPQI